VLQKIRSFLTVCWTFISTVVKITFVGIVIATIVAIKEIRQKVKHKKES